MLEKVKEIIANELHIDESEVADDADIIEDLGADSLSVVTILMSLEEETGVSIPDEAAAELRTPKDIAEYIENNK